MEQHSLKLIGKKNLQWHKKTLPTLEQDEILVKTMVGAISIGSELPQFMESDMTESSPRYPKDTGYESYGEVIETGEGVNAIKEGDRVLPFYGHKDYGIVKECIEGALGSKL